MSKGMDRRKRRRSRQSLCRRSAPRRGKRNRVEGFRSEVFGAVGPQPSPALRDFAPAGVTPRTVDSIAREGLAAFHARRTQSLI
jgi:hypothetical protein